MNPNNRASLEASKRLVDAGIVLETDVMWAEGSSGWFLCTVSDLAEYFENANAIPAPCMAEVWRELPEGSTLYNSGDIARAYMANPKLSGSYKTNTNPTDALIDLLIWVRKEAKDADLR